MQNKTLEDNINNGYISVRKHPTDEMYIYNYTRNAQFDGIWNGHTLNNRGTIRDGQGNVLFKPLSKFFSIEEAEQRGFYNPSKNFEVYDKMDGSLGILYWDSQGEPGIATRGSFESEQAIFATQYLGRVAL